MYKIAQKWMNYTNNVQKCLNNGENALGNKKMIMERGKIPTN